MKPFKDKLRSRCSIYFARVVLNNVEDLRATLSNEIIRSGLRDNVVKWVDGAVADLSPALLAKAFDHLLVSEEDAEATLARAGALHAKGHLFAKPEEEDEDDGEGVDEPDEVDEPIDLLVEDEEGAQEDVSVVMDRGEDNEQKDEHQDNEQKDDHQDNELKMLSRLQALRIVYGDRPVR